MIRESVERDARSVAAFIHSWMWATKSYRSLSTEEIDRMRRAGWAVLATEDVRDWDFSPMMLYVSFCASRGASAWRYIAREMEEYK